MTIAAHPDIDPRSDQNDLFECLKLLALKNPGDHFIFFVDSANAVKKITGKNITPVLIRPAIKNRLLLYYWYNFKLPGLLERYNADAFLSEKITLSLRTATTQYLFLKNISFLQGKQQKNKRLLLSHFSRFLKKAEKIFTSEKYIGAVILEKYPDEAKKIIPVFHGLNPIYQPVSWEQKENATKLFTEEKDYFLLYVSPNTRSNILPVLKAFSIFKKWQKSTMQLVLLLDNIAEEGLIPGLSLYKYRKEIKIRSAEKEERPELLIAAAYAVIYLPQHNMPENVGLHALQAHIPLITTSGEANRAMYENAALFTGLDEQDIAGKMQLLYKDESVRKNSISEGIKIVQKYNLESCSSKLWSAITRQN